MRHRKSINHLGRTASHRKSMLANMAASLIMNKRISTTTAKAKELRTFVEPLITKSKEDSTHSRRVVFSYLQNKDAVSELFREISPKIADRPGGYTRILKTGSRLGDNADMCIIELVDYNENLLAAKEESQAKAGRRRRRTGKKKAGDEISVVENVAVTETPEVINTGNVSDEVKEETAAGTEVIEEVVEEEVKAEEQVEETGSEEKSDTEDKKEE